MSKFLTATVTAAMLLLGALPLIALSTANAATIF